MEKENIFECEYNHSQTIDLETVTPLDFKCIAHMHRAICDQMHDFERLYLACVNSHKLTNEDEIKAEDFKIGKLADNLRCMLEMVVDVMDA